MLAYGRWQRTKILFVTTSCTIFSHSVDRASWYTCVITTNKMHYFFLIYFNNLSSTCFEQSNYWSSGGSYYIGSIWYLSCSYVDQPFDSDCVSSYSTHMHVNTTYCKHSNCFLITNCDSILNVQRIDYGNKLRKKGASCWSLLCRYA